MRHDILDNSASPGPDTILMTPDQPMPENAQVVPWYDGDVWRGNTVVRAWKTEQDVADCRLCPRGPCAAIGKVCCLNLRARVAPEDAWLYVHEGEVRLGAPGDVTRKGLSSS